MAAAAGFILLPSLGFAHTVHQELKKNPIGPVMAAPRWQDRHAN